MFWMLKREGEGDSYIGKLPDKINKKKINREERERERERERGRGGGGERGTDRQMKHWRNRRKENEVGSN